MTGLSTSSLMEATDPAVSTADRIDEAALARLDAMAKGAGFDTGLLATTPARDIRSAIEAALALLEKLDFRDVLAKQGRLSRLLGADVEARLKFELASQRVLSAMQLLRQAAANGKRITALLRTARDALTEDQARLEASIAWAQRLYAQGAEDAEPFVLARFERRFASMVAMSSSNLVTAEQMVLAENVLASLLDRVTDVDTILMPLWQRNMLALAHASVGRSTRDATTAFAEIQNRLITYLKQGESP